MKKLLLLVVCFILAGEAFAQSAYNYQRRSMFDSLAVRSSDIVFLGNSITDGCEWAELFDNRHVRNRGISGDRSSWLLERLDAIIEGHPKKLFLMIGINDLSDGTTPQAIVANIGKLLDRFALESPWTKIYVQSVLPVNDTMRSFSGLADNAHVREINRLLEELCASRPNKKVLYLDVHSALVDSDGRLDKRYTNDGLHLMGAGYLAWKEVLKPYVK